MNKSELKERAIDLLRQHHEEKYGDDPFEEGLYLLNNDEDVVGDIRVGDAETFGIPYPGPMWIELEASNVRKPSNIIKTAQLLYEEAAPTFGVPAGEESLDEYAEGIESALLNPVCASKTIRGSSRSVVKLYTTSRRLHANSTSDEQVIVTEPPYGQSAGWYQDREKEEVFYGPQNEGFEAWMNGESDPETIRELGGTDVLFFKGRTRVRAVHRPRRCGREGVNIIAKYDRSSQRFAVKTADETEYYDNRDDLEDAGYRTPREPYLPDYSSNNLNALVENTQILIFADDSIYHRQLPITKSVWKTNS